LNFFIPRAAFPRGGGQCSPDAPRPPRFRTDSNKLSFLKKLSLCGRSHAERGNEINCVTPIFIKKLFLALLAFFARNKGSLKDAETAEKI